jgi:hypothetical protein
VELTALLSKLKLEHLEPQVASVCEQAANQDLDYPTFLTRALAVEWQGRQQRGIEARLRRPASPGSKPWSSTISTSSPRWTAVRSRNWPPPASSS